jgi:WD40 repeat protein
MNRRLAVLGLVLMLTGCTGASTPSDRPSQAGATGGSTLPPAASPSPQPTASLRPEPLVAWIPWGDPGDPVSRIRISGAGGSDTRELVPGGSGNLFGRLAWSPDGAQLLYSRDGRLFLADVNGGEPQLLDTGCVAPCGRDTDPAFSRDGTTLAFARQSFDQDGIVESSAIATLDLAAGRVAVLASTAGDSAWWPSWSPDGQRIVFSSRYGEGDVPALFVVDQDGRNLHQISPSTLVAGNGEWSPDGSRIVFWTPAIGGRWETKDVYTIRPDGTDLRRLTSDGLSSAASWTADGQILFAKNNLDAGARGVSFWTMDADGTNATLLVPADAVDVGDDEFPTVRVAPQPLGGPAIAPIAQPDAPAITVGPPAPTPTPPALGPGFSLTGPMDATEFDPLGVIATGLADGRVLFVGGCDTRAQLYDPGTGAFSPTGPLSVARGGMTATLLRDGRVLVAGGYACETGDETWSSAELYDPTTGTFGPTGSMTAPRSQHTATLLEDGLVLIAGGLPGSSATAGGITFASYRLAAVDNFLTTAEVYDPVTGTFSKTDSMSAPHRRHTATRLQDGRVLVVGNGGEGGVGKAADVYDPATGRFTRTGSMKTGRGGHTATLLEDGRVLILGGRAADDTTTAFGELYDPDTGVFRPAGRMADGRSQHTATRLADGRVLIVGGWSYDGQMTDVLSGAELYDPGTGGFSSIGSIGTPRANHTATLLDDGRVLIAGGYDESRNGTVSVSSALLYQP